MNDELELEDEEYIDEDAVEDSYDDTTTMRKLPLLLEEWVTDVSKVSHHNEIPAAVICLVLLGQTVKDYIAIPTGTGVSEDTRLHFCWIQSSGTGKSAMMNFALPVSRGVWEGINLSCGKIPNGDIDRADLTSDTVDATIYAANKELSDTPYEEYDNFDVVEYTAAALLGHQKDFRNWDGQDDWRWVKGELDGHGLARWDEFTNSGVFETKQQHKEGIVTYLNTLMNTLHGESWKITKKLKEGPSCATHSQRSILATTFPPKNLTASIADTGLFQRMLLYIWIVPERVQDQIRDTIVDGFGVKTEKDLPIDYYVAKILEIFELTKARFNEVKQDKNNTVTFSADFHDALRLRKNDLTNWVDTTSGPVRDVAKNFMTRLLIMLGKISVLMCVAEAPTKSKKDRFIVTSENVTQSAHIVRYCYKALVEWLELSLKVTRDSLLKKADLAVFFKTYENMKNDTNNGLIGKNQFIKKVIEESGLGQVTIYNKWKKVENEFIVSKKGRSVFIKLRGEEK